jgi:glyoxylase-like metal-dependent hydrolase (beta-lactamase superfamily II)
MTPDPDKGPARQAVDGVAWLSLGIANVAFLDRPGGGFVLVDAGLPGTAGRIRRAAAERYGETARPAAILLTHGHFDHVGALETLAEAWDVPIVAAAAEHPYLDGRAAYPPPDPSVGGGLMSRLSPLFPRGPIDVKARLRALPEDGSIAELTAWRWLATPGHSAGHVSLWREADRTLVSGDAVITTRQESAYAALMHPAEIHGPPMYFTPDWEAAGRSARKLAALEPDVIVPGHGEPMQGEAMRRALHHLAETFFESAVPAEGRYVEKPAKAEDGSAYRRP